MIPQVKVPAKLAPIFTGQYRFRYSFGGRGSAKCLGKGTILIKYDASLIAVEDVKVGDLLLGPDGTPRKVLSTTQGIGQLYQVNQVTGMPYVVNDDHILVLERSASSKKDFGKFSKAGNPQRINGRYAGYDTGKGYSLITAKEYHEKPERFKSQHYGFRREIAGSHRELPVDPYLLGIWLGDGSSKAPEITNIDPEIIEFIYETAEENNWKVKKQGGGTKTPRYYISTNYQRAGSFFKQLRDSGVFRNKHIPECYFGSSIEQRLALLAGLIDTDGHVSMGCIAISQSKENLLDDIVRLAHGLGFKASKKFKPVKCNGKICSSWKAQIGGDIDRLPLKIERKRNAAKVIKNKDWRRTRIDVNPIGVGAYYGFELDGDHLFMLADGTVTHNTRTFAKMIAIKGIVLAQAGETGLLVGGREFMNSLSDSSFAEIKAAIASEQWLADRYDVGDQYIRTKDRRIEFAFIGLRHNLDSVKSKAKIHVLWIDEAERVTERAWQIIIPTVREVASELWITWNPEQKTSATNQRFRENPPTDSIGVEMNWRDNPWFPKVLNDARLEDLEKRPDYYGHIWDGAYRTMVEGAYYVAHLAEAKRQNRIGSVPADPMMTIRLFCDIGGTGARADNFVLIAAQFINKEIRVVNHYEVQGQPIASHLNWLRSEGYTPDRAQLWLPHDGVTHDKVYDISYESAFRKAGYHVEVVPNQGTGAAIQRIEALRMIFHAIWFNEETTKGLVSALGWYHEKRDEIRGIGLGPDHDWASHACDAAGLMAIAYEEPKIIKKSARSHNWRTV